MRSTARRWLFALGGVCLVLLAAVLLVIWVAGQVAGVLADHWPPVSYPLGALGELGAVLTHPRSAIAPEVPTAGFWLYFGAELVVLVTGSAKLARRRRWGRAPGPAAPTVVADGARDTDRFLLAYDRIARRDAAR